MAKSSSIRSPFSDAVVDHNAGKKGGSDKASPPKCTDECELFHNEKASGKQGKQPCYDRCD